MEMKMQKAKRLKWMEKNAEFGLLKKYAEGTAAEKWPTILKSIGEIIASFSLLGVANRDV